MSFNIIMKYNKLLTTDNHVFYMFFIILFLSLKKIQKAIFVSWFYFEFLNFFRVFSNKSVNLIILYMFHSDQLYMFRVKVDSQILIQETFNFKLYISNLKYNFS